jgi:signal transduction histidine kinase
LVGTGNGGLNRFDLNTSKFHRSRGNDVLGNGISITAIQEDSKNNLWVATTTGLVQVNRVNGKESYTKYSSKDGLPSDRIAGLLIDSNDKLWMSAVQGIFSLEFSEDSDAPAIKKYDAYNGAQDTEFAICSSHKGASGFFYFGGFGAFTIFHPDSMLSQGIPPQLAFTSLAVMNKPVSVNSDLDSKGNVVTRIGQEYYLTSAINQVNSIELSYQEQVFSIEYVALDFNHPEKNEYAHKLEGFDKEWVYDGRKNSVTYTSLPAGNYKLLVKGTNGNDFWSAVHALNIVITPPFWKTWWFITSISLAFILFVTFYVFSRFRRLEKEKVVLEEKVTERTAEIDLQRHEIEKKAIELFAANEKLVEMGVFKEKLTSMLVHDLKNPLGSIVNIARNSNENENSKSIEYSAKLMLNLVMNILDVQQLQKNKIAMNRRTINVAGLVTNALKYIHLSVKQKNLKINIELNEETTVLCDSNLIERVLINLLSNAVQYSSVNGEISIFSSVNNDQSISMVIQDNGKGISPKRLDQLNNKEQMIEKGSNKYSTGIGLQYCQLALAAHETQLKIESEEGIGTRVSFSLKQKVQKETFSNSVTSVEAKNVADLQLSSEIKIKLMPIANKLAELQFYEGGKVLQLLQAFEFEDAEALDWASEIKNAVYNSNEQKFEHLIELVLKLEA